LIYFAFKQTFPYPGSITTADPEYNTYIDRNDSLDLTPHGSFTENDDNPRVAWSNSNITIAANAIAFTILTNDIAIICQG
jgi:hypothetical protein